MASTHFRATRWPLFWRWLLAFLTALLFGASLLVVFSAPTEWLWIVAILIAEWGHYFALAAIILAALNWRRDRFGLTTTVLALAAAFLCAWPALRALSIGQTLEARCTEAFGPKVNPAGKGKPFRILNLFRGAPLTEVQVEEHQYASDGRKRLKLDLYRPTRETGPLPVIVMIHGGSWNGGNKRQLRALDLFLAHEGYAVAALNYRHAPKRPFPAAVEDVFRALAFLRAHANQFQLDLSRVVLVGRSAGGQIALSAAYANRDPAVRGVASFYGPSDLVLGYEKPSRRGVLDSKKVLEAYLGGSPAQRPAEYAAASPINFVSATTPPTLLVHGQLDPIVWPAQSEVLGARLTSAGRPHLYLALPWATHGCEANINGPSGQLSLYALDRLLANVLPLEPGG